MTGSRRALIVVAVFVAAVFGLPGIGAVPEAAAQVIQVESALPDTAAQGTISLPVTIKGSGFKRGAKAKFYLPNTTNPGGITVSSTKFVDSTQLVATIDVAETAVISGFDIVVANTDGRTGKGTELFTVTTKASSRITELYAEFRDAVTDKIRSDQLGRYMSETDTPSYPNDVYLSDVGSLFMRIQKDRKLVFQFDVPSPSRPVPIDGQGRVVCHEYEMAGFGFFTSPAPAFLTQGGVPNNDASWITVNGEFTFDIQNQSWSYSSSPFDFRAMAVNGTAYVALNVRFDIVENVESFFAAPDHKLWSTPGPRAGIARVSHPDADTWIVEPLPAGDPNAPLRSLGPDEASLWQSASAVKKVHAAGYCDLGDWVMPFQLTLRRR